MIRFSLAGAAVAASLIPVLAQAQTSPDHDALVQAFISVGCVIDSEDSANAVLAASGLTEAQAGAAAEQMMAAGVLQERQDVVTLLHPDCPGGDVATASGWEEAIAWMNALSAEQAGGVLAELLTVRGCFVGNDEFGSFEEEVATAVAGRFGIDLLGPDFEHTDAFFDALDNMGNRGGGYLDNAGRIEERADGSRLIGCDAPAAAEGASAAPQTDAQLQDALLFLGSEEIAAIENATIAEIACRVPADMGFNFSAMVLDRVLASVGYDLGPSGALAVMGPIRVAQFYRGPNDGALNYASGLVNDTVQGMVRDGRLVPEGRMLVAPGCDPVAGNPDAILPYLIGRP